ncbi:MAG: phytanoyl-CoA dioxygenase family protein [Planctomycetaceae bacterium]
MKLTATQLQTFRQTGHVTVEGIFTAEEIAAAISDMEAWSREFLSSLDETQHGWFLERRAGPEVVLRKLDNPVFHRPVFRTMACDERLTGIVEQLIGPGVGVFFSQIFCKPPEVGGPKPVHQDNFYFGPDDEDATLTVWIALDDATLENGCLFYADGSNLGPVLPHVAPENEPFNLQVTGDELQNAMMTAAPVSAGGVLFHHGNTLHQSAANRSSKSRRAAAFHYLRNGARLMKPSLTYDAAVAVRITDA